MCTSLLHNFLFSEISLQGSDPHPKDQNFRPRSGPSKNILIRITTLGSIKTDSEANALENSTSPEPNLPGIKNDVGTEKVPVLYEPDCLQASITIVYILK